MKSPGQLAFEAYQESLAENTLHSLDSSEAHIQPWVTLSPHYQRAWDAAARAAQPVKAAKS